MFMEDKKYKRENIIKPGLSQNIEDDNEVMLIIQDASKKIAELKKDQKEFTIHWIDLGYDFAFNIMVELYDIRGSKATSVKLKPFILSWFYFKLVSWYRYTTLEIKWRPFFKFWVSKTD